MLFRSTQIEAIRRGAPGGLIFQSICGSEKGLKEFGVELAMLDEARAVGAEFNRIAGENCLYFETGQGSALSAGANFGADQVTMEARNYGLARHYDPFIVNTVVGFIGPEYLYNDRQIHQHPDDGMEPIDLLAIHDDERSHVATRSFGCVKKLTRTGKRGLSEALLLKQKSRPHGQLSRKCLAVPEWD